MTKISITGVTGFRNRGVEALVQPIIKGLNAKYPGNQITIYTGSPDYDARHNCGDNVQFVAEGDAHMNRGPISRRLKRFGIDSGRGRYNGWDKIENSDLLIVTGGDVFSSEYGDMSFERHLVPMRVAKMRGIPFFIFAQSIGPFTTVNHRKWFLDIAKHAGQISVREERTFSYLTRDLGLTDEQVVIVADPAFLLKADSTPALNLFGKTTGAVPHVAVSISKAIFEWVGDDRERRLATWAMLFERMIDQWGVRILLIPHVQEPYADDTEACTDIWRKMAFNPRVRVCGEDYSASEYKGILSKCEMVVAERMHAGIGGISSGVCTSIIAYSVKARGIVEAMVGKEFAAKGALVEGAAFSDPELVWTKLNFTWEQRREIQQRIALALPGAVENAKRAFELLPLISRK